MNVWCAIGTLTPAAAPLHVPPSARAERALRAVGAQLAVTGGTQLSLSGCTLEDSTRLTTFTDSSLSLASMAVPAAVLGRPEGRTMQALMAGRRHYL